jgi:ribosomal protein S18 acetylase RimI-like enzyme
MIVNLTSDHVRQHLAAYIAVSADVSDWAEQHFLSDLPGKWELSFAWLDQNPLAYCVMSRKFGPPHIHQFMVHPELRGRGIGEKMLAEAERRGAETLKVAKNNVGATRFYERCGWTKQKEAGDYLWMISPMVGRRRDLPVGGGDREGAEPRFVDNL